MTVSIDKFDIRDIKAVKRIKFLLSLINYKTIMFTFLYYYLLKLIVKDHLSIKILQYRFSGKIKYGGPTTSRHCQTLK